MSLPPAVAIVGPTASGKARLGAALAKMTQLPILVCDSVKVYRGLDIGSAKPSLQARAATRFELIDLVDPDVNFSAGAYGRAAWEVFEKTGGVFVGGTGLYLRAAVQVLTAPDAEGDREPGVLDPRREAFEARWLEAEAGEVGALHAELSRRDPETAQEIHAHNIHRLVRALWLCELHGEPISAVRAACPPRERVRLLTLVLDPPAPALAVAIERRVDTMLDRGFLQEVEKLRAHGYDGSFRSMNSLGYKQLLDVVEGRRGLPDARAEIIRETKRYARRQRTFFRRQLPGELVTVTDPSQAPLERLVQHLQEASS